MPLQIEVYHKAEDFPRPYGHFPDLMVNDSTKSAKMVVNVEFMLRDMLMIVLYLSLVLYYPLYVK